MLSTKNINSGFETQALNQIENYKRALRVVKGRKDGIITSLTTPWKKFNDEGINGIDWGSFVVFGARSGVGKTMAKDQLVREAYRLNQNTDIEIVEFQFEMPGDKHALRQLVGTTGIDYNILNSKDQPLNDETYRKLEELVNEKLANRKMPLVIDVPLGVQQMKEEMDYYSRVVFKDKKVIYTLDHSLLVRRKPKQNERDMLIELSLMITEMKNKYADRFIFILLSQLNRNILDPSRNENGKIGNYINDSDIAGSDSIMQAADIVVGMNRPGKFNITTYGVAKHLITSQNTVVWHMIKTRYSEPGNMLWFEIDGSTMSLVEVEEPDVKPNVNYNNAF